MGILLTLSIALASYYLHDTAQLFIASQLKKRRGEGFPADVTSYFNLQRIGLTLFWGKGWSSEHHFLYNNASEFRFGRISVFIIHLLSPILYALIGSTFLLLTIYLSFLPAFIRELLFFTTMFNMQMAILMLIPIPPLSMGRALFCYYTRSGYEVKMKQIEFYGTLVLVGFIFASFIGYDILPLDAIQRYFLSKISTMLG